MTEKEQKYRAHFRNIGKHLHKNEYMPLNLAKHPLEFRNDSFRDSKPVLVNWGWAARTDRGAIYIPRAFGKHDVSDARFSKSSKKRSLDDKKRDNNYKV